MSATKQQFIEGKYGGIMNRWRAFMGKTSQTRLAQVADCHKTVDPHKILPLGFWELSCPVSELMDLGSNRIGSGAQGFVYRAKRRLDDCIMAVKAVPLPRGDPSKMMKEDREKWEKRWDRIHREAVVLRSLQWVVLSHVLKPWASFTSERHHMLAMPLALCSYDQYLMASYALNQKAHGPQRAEMEKLHALSRCLHVADMVESVVEFQRIRATKAGLQLVHRDLKPGNWLMFGTDCGRGCLKLTDWGLLCFEDPSGKHTCLSGPGTPGHTAPETSDKDRPSCQASDYYGLCVTLMVTFNIGLGDILRKRPDMATPERMQSLLMGTSRYGADLFGHIPYGRNSFLATMLRDDPDTRGTALQLKAEMEWLRHNRKCPQYPQHPSNAMYLATEWMQNRNQRMKIVGYIRSVIRHHQHSEDQ